MSLESYLNLIPSQHRQRPCYMATVAAVLRPVQGVAELLERMRTVFDLDTAVGAQLDAAGVRIGRTRHLRTPLEGVYFSLDVEGVGLEEGVWKGPYDPDGGLISLPDDLYRTLLKAKVAANSWDGTVPGAYAAWEIAFVGTGSFIVIEDHQDMSMVIGIAGQTLSPVFEQLLLQGYLPLKPEGVRLNWYAISTEEGPLFALDCDSQALAGLEIGSWPKEIHPIQE